jgi:nickel/cobalt transporter (NiCoT) family protein
VLPSASSKLCCPRQGSLCDLLIQIFDGQGGNLRVRLTGLYTFLIAVNLAAWAWVFCSFHDHAVMLATAIF